jgi:hypothetical protein
MKRSFILAASAVLFVSWNVNAQVQGLSLTPSGDKEIVVVKFRAPADANFLIFEAKLPARTAEECMASTDFSSAVPALNSAGVYDPITATWYLKNSNTNSTKDSCTVIIMRSSANSGDLALWRAHYGSTLPSIELGDSKNTVEAKAQRSMVTSLAVTFDRPI